MELFSDQWITQVWSPSTRSVPGDTAVGMVNLQTPRVDQLAGGSQAMKMEKRNGKRRKTEAQTAQASCISRGVQEEDFCSSPKSV